MMPLTMDTLVSLSKRRGFVFQSSEIYGGTGSCWDYGPLGVELKNNIKAAWWRDSVRRRSDMVGIDAAILMHPRVWEASGHMEHFHDPKVDCKKCNGRFRFDDVVPVKHATAGAGPAEFRLTLPLLYDPHARVVVGLVEVRVGPDGARLSDLALVVDARAHRAASPPEGLPWAKRQALFAGPTPCPLAASDKAGAFFVVPIPPELQLEKAKALAVVFDLGDGGRAEIPAVTHKYACPSCGGQLTEPRQFQLMFKTFMGPVEDDASIAYLRPETAQGIFVNFENVLSASRKKLPFGIAQIGKSFRNEITPGNFIFRTREFEQMEIEFFVKPGTDEEWHDHWIGERTAWYRRHGIREENLRVREHGKDELSHYSKRTVDLEYKFPIGWSELEGIANRTDYDLSRHGQFSGKPLSFFDEETKKHIVPYVIEPSAGVDRSFLAFLCDAYHEEQVRGEKRVVLKLHPKLAPIQVAVLPLLKKRDDIVRQAQEIVAELREDVHAVYDDTASIGRLYRRQDEVGTPLCVTVDVETVEKDRRVTVRERDSMEQVRVPIGELRGVVGDALGKGWPAVRERYGTWSSSSEPE